MGMKVSLVKSYLSRSLSSATEALKDVVQDTFEDIIRDVGRWAKGTAILYGVGAVLALAAVFTLALGLAEVLVAIGLPGYAGYLIIAVLLGITAYGLFKAGSKRRVRPRKEDESDRPSLRIHIGTRTVRPARRRVYDVHRARRGWEVTGPRSERRSFRNKGKAVSAAR